MTAELVPGRWQSIRFDHLEKLGPNRRGRIRLDPVNCLAFVNISSIRLITDSDKRVFYSASSAADFAQINVSEGVLKHETDGILELVATDSDPQVFLPEINFPSGDSWHLEVDLEVHTAPSNIILRQKETFALVGRANCNIADERSAKPRARSAGKARQRTNCLARERTPQFTTRGQRNYRSRPLSFRPNWKPNARRMKNKSATLNNKRTSRRASLKKRDAPCSKAAMKPRDSRAFWKFGIRTALVSHFTTPGSEAVRRFRTDCSRLAWPRSMAVPRCPDCRFDPRGH